MLLSYNRLVKLIEDGVINAPIENVNASSIDITLGDEILVESKVLAINGGKDFVKLYEKENISFNSVPLGEDHLIYFLNPDDFILATSNEIFNLPNNISCEYKLKSSMARNGLEHLTAGWCDAGWNGSKLTLEFKNMTKYHTLLLKPGMKIGQMVFFEHEPVPDHASYAAKGRYNNQTTTTAGKGIL